MENDYDNGNVYYMGPINFSGGKAKRFFITIKDFFLNLRNIHIFSRNSNKNFLFDEDDQAVPEIGSIGIDDKEFVSAEIEFTGNYRGQEDEKVTSSNHLTTIKEKFGKAKVICPNETDPYYAKGKSKNETEVGCRIRNYDTESFKRSMKKKKKRYNEEFEF